MGKLRNPRHERFAIECASMTPIGRAYELAGFRSKPVWCRPNGVKLARNPAVAARIDELQREFKASAALHVEYLQSLALPCAEANIADFLADDGAFKRLSELTRSQSAAIQSITFNADGTVADLKLVPKNESIKLLMTSIGATGVQRHEHEHAVVGIGDRLEAALARARAMKYEDAQIVVEALEALPIEADGDSQTEIR